MENDYSGGSQDNPYDAGKADVGPPPTSGVNSTAQTLAIISLASGLLGISAMCCVFLMPIPLVAIVTGGIALTQNKPSNNGVTIMSIIGLALGLLAFAGFGLMILLNLGAAAAGAVSG
ncbi:MAG: DUF4190 domain-containing protein [Pirellulaceae bacterium]|jgi:hypothetical protein|nr:DUF4190 domain-containing protein [Pirellulaceae bacterium]MDP7015391.1 DUF4190 domain-containing protein [Pirellulaceae bacterium]